MHSRQKKVPPGTKNPSGSRTSDPMGETMHAGFQPYRKKSKHIMDVEKNATEMQNRNNTDLKPHASRHNNKKPQQQKKPGRKKASVSSILKPETTLPVPKDSISTSASSRSSRLSSEKITFHPEDEVREYIVQPRSYRPNFLGEMKVSPMISMFEAKFEPILRLEITRLDIFSHADHLWLEHANRSAGSLPIYDYQYNVFDDSEQRILFIRPSFDYMEKAAPNTFMVFTAIGAELSKLEVRRKVCCSKKELVLDITLRGKKIGSVVKIGNSFVAFDPKGAEIIDMEIQLDENASNAEGKSKGGLSCFKQTSRKTREYQLPVDIDKFQCDVYFCPKSRTRKEVPFGTIRGNGMERENCKFSIGEPGGFYWMVNETNPSSPRQSPTITKLFIVTTLVALMVFYRDPLPKKKLSADSKTKRSIKSSASRQSSFTGELNEHLTPVSSHYRLPSKQQLQQLSNSSENLQDPIR